MPTPTLTAVSRALAVLAALTLGSACAPNCETTCNKIIRCELADNFEQLECEEACTRQSAQFEVEDNRTLKQDFRAHRSCIRSSTCEELEAGECYDEDLFQF
ncbi:MAG: hypothetical protein ACJAZO_002341 [Myxococcota bacterium]|jgi:hypothetical protein